MANYMQKINLKPYIVFKYLKFKTSGNLVGGWEPMPDNANPKQHIFVASMDI